MRILQKSLFILGIVLIVSQLWASEVRNLAPGVFFRTADHGCNNGWIVMDQYVLVIDANFPDEAEKVIQDIRKTTDKPIRLVLDTHYHGDHVMGNGVFAKLGAVIIAQKDLRVDPEAMQESYKNWTIQHPDYKDLPFVEASQYFDEHLVFEDKQHRVEFLHLGHGHTPGDVVVYLPKEKILFTGDVCVNGAYNYMGQCNLSNWIDVLERLGELDVQTVCPGHGPSAGSDLLKKQRDYFIALRDQVNAGIQSDKSLDEIVQSIQIPFYKEWTGVAPRKPNIITVYNFLSGNTMPPELHELGLEAGPSPTKDTPGWTPPKKLVTVRYNQEMVKALERVAPELQIVNVNTQDELKREIQDADGCLTYLNSGLLQTAPHLRWVHSISAGVEKFMYPDLINHPLVLTNGQGKSGPPISDTVLGYMLMLARGLGAQYKSQLEGRWERLNDYPRQILDKKNLLILGLGGIGGQIAKKAAGFGMQIYAIDPAQIERPYYVRKIAPPQEIETYLPKADFVVSTVPLTKHTNRYFSKSYFERMKPSAYFINIGRGRTVNQDDLVEALRNHTIAGAALDVTDPEPLPKGNPLWNFDNVIITPHVSGWSKEGNDLSWLIIRENVRRFATGEPLLNVVDKTKGY